MFYCSLFTLIALKFVALTYGIDGLLTPRGAVWAYLRTILWESSCVLPMFYSIFGVCVFTSMLTWFSSSKPPVMQFSPEIPWLPSIISSGVIPFNILFYYSRISMRPMY
jgi:hypothetical protein